MNTNGAEDLVVNIVGETVALGPLRRDLLPLYGRWLNDFGTVRTLAMPPRPLTLDAEEAWYDRAAVATGTAAFTVYERATGRPIGRADLRDINPRDRTAGIALFIGEPDARGKGYGTATVRLLLDHAFTALGLHNVMLTVYAFNRAGLRAYQKAGFREIGRRRECHLLNGRLWDEIYLDCLAGEFAGPAPGAVCRPDDP